MKLFISLTCLLFSISLIGQAPQLDVSSGYDLSSKEAGAISAKLLSFKEDYTASKRTMKRYNKICDSRHKSFLEDQEAHRIMGHGELQALLQAVADKIVTSNSDQLKSNHFKIFIARTPEVNAFNMGKGIISINIGLLARISDVDEIAYVIAHEMGHDISNHVLESSIKHCEFYNGPAYKALKKASRKTYGNATAQEDLINKILASKGLHSRKNEFVADKIGTKLALKAGFGREGVLEALEMLRDSDEPLWNDSLDIQKMLSTEDYQIPTKYLTEVDAYAIWSRLESLGKIPDSLRTHPNCDERIEQVKKIAKPKSSQHAFQEDYKQMHQAIKYEFLHTLIETNNLSRALYYGLVAKHRGDENPFIDALITFCLYDLNQAVIDRSFADKVSFPDERFSNGYNKLLEFLQAQNSSRLLKIANGYYRAHLAQAEDFEFKRFITLYKTFIEKNKLKTTQVKQANLQNSFYKDFIHQLKL